MIFYLYLLISLLLTVLVHEAGHCISALLLKIKVKAFSIGFGKPYLHKKLFGIDWRLSPVLFGGYTEFAGEHDATEKRGFLIQPYWKKAIILLAGVTMNALIACICYWFNYNSIIKGILVDWYLMVSVFTNNEELLGMLLTMPKSFLLLQISFLNFGCCIFNLLPFPPLDGGILWLVKVKKKFPKINLKKIIHIGFIILIILQLLIIYCLYFV